MTQKTFDSQTATFISRLVTSFPGDLTGPEMQRCIDDPKGLSSAINTWLRPTVIATAVGLLLLVGNPVTIPPSTQSFIAAKKLKVDTTNDTELKISCLGDNLKKWFLRKVEEPFAGSQLRVQKLIQSSVDGPILNELGGEEAAETTLCEMFEFLKTAPHAWYIFYIKDVNQRLRAVRAFWDEGGWDLDASALRGPHEWGAGSHVVSRN